MFSLPSSLLLKYFRPWWVVGFLVIWVLFFGQIGAADTCLQLSPEAALSSFVRMEPGKTHQELGIDESYQANPKIWNIKDQQVIEIAFKSAWSHLRFRRVVCFVNSKAGAMTFRRYEILSSIPNAAAWMFKKVNILGVGDNYFKLFRESPKTASRALIHEYLHKADELLGMVSWQPKYWDLLQFEYQYDKQNPQVVIWRNRHIPVNTPQEMLNYEEYLRRNFGFPSRLSLSNPLESFADIGSFLIVEPAAIANLPKTIKDFFIETIDHL